MQVYTYKTEYIKFFKRVLIVQTLNLLCFLHFTSDCSVDSSELKRFLNWRLIVWNNYLTLKHYFALWLIIWLEWHINLNVNMVAETAPYKAFPTQLCVMIFDQTFLRRSLSDWLLFCSSSYYWFGMNLSMHYVFIPFIINTEGVLNLQKVKLIQLIIKISNHGKGYKIFTEGCGWG